jgi:hypothetical protein
MTTPRPLEKRVYALDVGGAAHQEPPVRGVDVLAAGPLPRSAW